MKRREHSLSAASQIRRTSAAAPSSAVCALAVAGPELEIGRSS